MAAVIGIIKLLELSHQHGTIIDDILAFDSALFLASRLFSYLSVRTPRDIARLEHAADLQFPLGMAVIVASGFLLLYALGSV